MLGRLLPVTGRSSLRPAQATLRLRLAASFVTEAESQSAPTITTEEPFESSSPDPASAEPTDTTIRRVVPGSFKRSGAAPTTEELEKRKMAYTVQRSSFNQLPVYHDIKAGGTLKLTLVRKIVGNPEGLVNDLKGKLKPKPKQIGINRLTNSVFVTGHCKEQVMEILRTKGF